MNFAVSLRLGRLLLGTTLCCLPRGAIYAQSASSNSATAPAVAAPGVILVDLTGNGTRNDHYWQYEVRPSSGLVRLVKDEQFKLGSQTDLPHIFQEPAGQFKGVKPRFLHHRQTVGLPHGVQAVHSMMKKSQSPRAVRRLRCVDGAAKTDRYRASLGLQMVDRWRS